VDAPSASAANATLPELELIAAEPEDPFSKEVPSRLLQ
jgi:hypothetical protein